MPNLIKDVFHLFIYTKPCKVIAYYNGMLQDDTCTNDTSIAELEQYNYMEWPIYIAWNVTKDWRIIL